MRDEPEARLWVDWVHARRAATGHTKQHWDVWTGNGLYWAAGKEVDKAVQNRFTMQIINMVSICQA